MNNNNIHEIPGAGGRYVVSQPNDRPGTLARTSWQTHPVTYLTNSPSERRTLLSLHIVSGYNDDTLLGLADRVFLALLSRETFGNAGEAIDRFQINVKPYQSDKRLLEAYFNRTLNPQPQGFIFGQPAREVPGGRGGNIGHFPSQYPNTGGVNARGVGTGRESFNPNQRRD